MWNPVWHQAITQSFLQGETESNSKAKRDILTVIENLTRIAWEL